jgi:SiaC family regulatory phosphoprotein
MEALDLKATNDTPKVLLDPENNIFEISGRSLPEDVVSFYQPVIDWLDEYRDNPNKSTEFVFKYIYFNTATSKLVQDILIKLEEISEDGNEVKVMWYYVEDDEDMLDLGEEFSENVDIPFEIIAY